MAKQISKVAINAPAFELGRTASSFVRVKLSSAQILALNTTPVPLVPAPGAGKVLIFKGMVFEFNKGTAYANGAAIVPVYHGATADLSGTTTGVAATVLTGSANLTVFVPVAAVLNPATPNVGIDLYTATAFITGTGTATLKVFFNTVTQG